MLKAIKVRIYPNNDQIEYLNNLFGASRFVFNKGLEYKKTMYEKDKTSISFGQLAKYINTLKSNEHTWLSNSHSKVLQQSLKHLDTSYKNFFKHNFGYPKFKSKHDKQSVEFRIDAISKNFIVGNRLNLITQLKDIHFKCSKTDEKYLNKKDLIYKSATLSKSKTNKYYLSILVHRDNKQIQTTNNTIGIDLGIKTYLTTSDGEIIENPKYIRSNEIKLKKLHRNLSRKVKGSKNKEKARLKLAKFHEKISNQKEYFLHQITNKIIKDNQIIILEDLNVKGMLKNHKLAKSIQELSLHRFKSLLEYKSKWYNRDLIFVDRFYPSSKTCSNCGNKKEDLTLKDRTYHCSPCGYEIDRDLNAAINIHNEGLRIYKDKIGHSLSELTPMECNTLVPLRSRNINGLL